MSSIMDMVNQPSFYEKIKYTNFFEANQNLINPVFDASSTDVFTKPPVSTKNPINISKSNIYSNCDQKCSFDFSYYQSLLIGKNNTNQMTFITEKNQVPPVTYNAMKYTVSSFSLFSPSLHIWNGESVPAEIVIEHIPVLGGNPLYISIPILQTSGIATTSASLITDIITEMSKKAPSNGGTTNLSITNFTLQKIVPNGPFYSYYGESKLFQGDFIVYDKTVNISLTSQTLKQLSSMIQPLNNPMFGGNLFYNPLGTNTGESDIYISCQPTGSSDTPAPKEDDFTKYKDINKNVNDLENFFTSETFMIFLICIFFIIGIFLLNFLFNIFTMGRGMYFPPSLRDIPSSLFS